MASLDAETPTSESKKGQVETPDWHEVTEFLQQLRHEGFIADPRPIVQQRDASPQITPAWVGSTPQTEAAAFHFALGLVLLTRLRRYQWLEGAITKDEYMRGVAEMFTCLVEIRDVLPRQPFAHFFDPMLS